MLTISVATLLAGTILSGCESSTKKVENARENLQDAKENVVEAKIDLNQALKDSIQSFKTELDQKISIYDKNIAALNTKLVSQKKDKKAPYEKALTELELKSKQLKKKLQEYKEEGIDSWTSFKKEFKHDMDELGVAINDLTKNNVK
ncbi:MAG: hypothetical protein HQ521_15000 [Bacteroidetes bacterium]|nr:hypothetical protein [Bacteroidota bacterium]